MPSSRPETLRQALASAGIAAHAALSDGARRIPLASLLGQSWLGARRAACAGKSVVIAAATQIEAAAFLADLDGLARRMVLLPPDARDQHLPAILRDAEADVIAASNPERFASLGVPVIQIEESAIPLAPNPAPVIETEWLMLTSGTTGDPKIAVHRLSGLSGAIAALKPGDRRPVWATFYDIRRYGGLQIFLRAMFGGTSLVLSRPDEPIAGHLRRLKAEGVTHMSGTPTHWRRVLMSSSAAEFAPDYIRLSGEIADQAILDALHQAYPCAAIGHAYASTEAGVGFDVSDGQEGFPEAYLKAPRNGVALRIVDGALQLRSSRAASSYAGRPDLALADSEGWVDSGDMIEISGGRCRFAGRRGGVINVGGLKVHPEEIESVLNGHAAVRQSRVKPRKSPILGAIVVADVVLKEEVAGSEGLKQDILSLCRSALPPHKIPALVNIVAAIEMTAGGKVSRQHA